MSAPRPRLWLAAVLVACCFAVLIRGVHAGQQTNRLRGDGEVYHEMAVRLLEEGYLGYDAGHYRSWRPPLYPAFLAGIYSIAGPEPLVARWVEAFVSGFVGLFLALLARRLGMPLAGLLAVYLYALSGAELRHAMRLYPENLTSLLVLVFVWAGTFAPAWWRAAGRGVLAAGVIHLQPGFLLLPVLDAAWTAWSRRRERGWVPAGVLLLALAAASAPWALRNHALHGRLILVSTNGGFNLLKGYHEGADGGPTTTEGPAVQEVVAAAPREEVAADRHYRATALRWIREDPGRAAWLVLRRVRYWYLPAYFFLPGSWWPITFGLVGPLAIAGAVIGWRRRIEVGVLLRPIVALSVPGVLVVYAGSRYRMPATPLIVILAAIPLAILAAALRARFAPGGPENPPPEEDRGPQ